MTYVSKAPSEQIASLLPSTIGSLTDETNAWKIGIGKMTDKPDQQIVIYDAPGQRPDPKWLLDYPYIQVMVRGIPQGYQSAIAKMRDVYDFLLGVYPATFGNGDRLDAVTGLTSPSLIGYDVNDRPRISVNLRLIFEPAASQFTNRLPL